MTGAALPKLFSWHADWSKLRAVVLGLSVTGFSVADTLTELGAEVLVLSENASEEYLRLLPVIGARSLIGPLDTVPQELQNAGADVVIASPGFAPSHPVIQWVRGQQIPLWGDLELAWRVRDKVLRPDGSPASWILVTGTNGKTTTTRMTAAMLAAGGMRTAPVGNIGTPVLDAVRDPGGFDVLVVEVSSHQLWYLGLDVNERGISPLASVCLNLADDHLEWHGSFAAYRAAKAVVYQNTQVACVYNKSDPQTRRMVEEAEVIEGARAVGFDLGIPGPSDLGLVEGILVDRAFTPQRHTNAQELTTVAALDRQGMAAPHLVTNALAASALARAAGVEAVAVRDALGAFSLDPHRSQLVVTAAGVRWIDDSKATNSHAAASSLRAYPGAIWIAGGQLKGIDIGPLVAEHGHRAKAVIVIGTDREPIREAFLRHAPDVPVFEVDHAQTENIMFRAVELAAGIAARGDVVLLAPAAASFDQFASYADRGLQFAGAVKARVESEGGDDTDSPSTVPG